MALTYKEANDFIADFVAMRDGAPDSLASLSISLYPELKYDDSLIKAGTRINWNGTIKRAAADLWDTEINNPENAPTLWEDIDYKEGYRIIPEVISAGAAFALDECGWWNDVLYKSLIDNNVWTPAANPSGWATVE